MRVRLPVIVLCLLLPALACAEGWRPLYESVDPGLQAAMEMRLQGNPEWAKLTSRKKMAIGLVDLSGETPRFAHVNGNQMMYAASLPKIAILLSAYVSFEDGSLPETDEFHKDLGDMIRVSSNSAATRLIDAVGMKKIQAVMKDPQYGFYDEKRGGGLWVGKRFAKSGPRVGDPINNISHGATATQVCRFFYLLASERLISPQRAPGAEMYRKSGTWKQWHADAIMVHGTHWRDYILVGLVESENGENILRQVLPVMEELIEPVEYAAASIDKRGVAVYQ
jgi:beta-lactamase class A